MVSNLLYKMLRWKPTMTKEEYRDYLKSPEWSRERKKHYGKPHNRFCCICGSKQELNVHHKTYAKNRYGWTNLITVCKKHHRQIHRLPYSTKKATNIVCDKWRKRHKGKTFLEEYLEQNPRYRKRFVAKRKMSSSEKRYQKKIRKKRQNKKWQWTIRRMRREGICTVTEKDIERMIKERGKNPKILQTTS